jgi:hypothetical protein
MCCKSIAVVSARRVLAEILADGTPTRAVAVVRGPRLKVVVAIVPLKAKKKMTPALRDFLPTTVQRAILLALDGRALRSRALAKAIGARLDGIDALIGYGLIEWHRATGYNRTEQPTSRS